MIFKFCVLLASFTLLGFGQTVSNISCPAISGGSFAVTFDVSSNFTNLRIRYGLTSTAGGTGGTVQTLGTSSDSYRNREMTTNLSGLDDLTQYYISPEVYNGATWSTGVETTCTTTADNLTIIPPEDVDVDIAAPSLPPLYVMADCSNLQIQLNAALPGQEVIVPKGTTCTSGYTLPANSAALSFGPSDVRTSDSRITVTHSFTANQPIMLGGGSPSSTYLPGGRIFNVNQNSDRSPGWHKGQTYYAGAVDSTHIQLLDAPNGTPVPAGSIRFTCNAGTNEITFSPTWKMPLGFQTAAGAGIAANTQIQLHTTNTLCGGLSVNQTYFILTPCSTNGSTDCVTKLSLTASGAEEDITSTGSGNHTIVDPGNGMFYVTAVNSMSGPKKVLRSDGNLPPAGVSVLDVPDTEFFYIRQNNILTTSPRLQSGILASDWVIKGALFDTGGTTVNTDYLTMLDPRPFCGIFNIELDVQNILFDQIRVKGPGYPNRFGCSTAMFLNGRNVGIVNSELTGLDYWHPWFSGFTGSVESAGAVARLSAGSGYSGALIFGTTTTSGNSDLSSLSGMSNDVAITSIASCVVTSTGHGLSTAHYVDITGNAESVYNTRWDVTVTNANTYTLVTNKVSGAACSSVLTGAGGTGRQYWLAPWYLRMNGTMRATLPTGGSASISCPGTTCDVTTQATPSFPVDGTYGRSTALKIATVRIRTNTVQSVDAADAFSSANATEGSQALICGFGPGPYIFSNNFVSGTGIPVHCDDYGDAFLTRKSYTFHKNFFLTPIEKLANGSIYSDTLRYGHRQPLEWKGGLQISLLGNIFDGCFSEISPASVCVAFTPRAGGQVSDVLMRSNWVRRSNGGFNTVAPIEAYHPISQPSVRTEISNNLFQLDGVTQAIIGSMGKGWAFYGGYAMDGMDIKNNTVWKPKGSIPSFLYLVQNPVSNVSITKNVIGRATGTNDGYWVRGENVANCALNSYALAQCMFTKGPGNPAYTFSNNAVITSWADAHLATPTTSLSESNVCQNEFNGTFAANACGGSSIVTLFPHAATVDARWDSLGYVDPDATPGNFRKSPGASITTSGVDGVDFETLLNDAGIVRDVVFTPAGLLVTATYTAPDSRACYVEISTDSGATWGTPESDGGGAVSRSMVVDGLTPLTNYTGRVLCYKNQTAARGATADQITTHDFTTLDGILPGGGITVGAGVMFGGTPK